jgi:predicted transcriptional regulator of viral defense system
MRPKGHPNGLQLLDEFVSEGRAQFTSAEAAARLGRSATATGNLLARLARDGLLDRVRRGHYAIRQLGTLGTTAAAENVLLSVAAGFRDIPHRVAYRTALDQLDLLAHPSRAIQVALAKPTRSETLSGRRLTVVQEPETALEVGAKNQDGAFISDMERSLLDAAARPELVGGIAVLAEALGAASSKGVDADRLTKYARLLSWGPALRRIGSLGDTLHIDGLAGRLQPLTKPSSDIDLEPGHKASSYRDAKWWVRWGHLPSELQNVVHQ